MSDQDRISPFNINTESSRLMGRIKMKTQLGGPQGDPIPNSPNLNHKYFKADSRENYKWDLGS